MNRNGKLTTRVMLGTIVLVTLLSVAGTAAAVEEGGGLTEGAGGIAIGAALAIGLAGLGTGLAQKDVGASAVGAMAEDPGFLGKGILMIAIPETIVILGFVIAFLMLGSL